MTTETTVCNALVSRILKAGYMISVYDGGEFCLKRSTNRRAIINALYSTDEDTLVVRRADGTKVGDIFLVYGNSPEEVIADYTDNEEIRALVN